MSSFKSAFREGQVGRRVLDHVFPTHSLTMAAHTWVGACGSCGFAQHPRSRGSRCPALSSFREQGLVEASGHHWRCPLRGRSLRSVGDTEAAHACSCGRPTRRASRAGPRPPDARGLLRVMTADTSPGAQCPWEP